MPEPTPTARPLPGRQQEARSNDATVLIAAREVFSAKGHDASMAEIARHAGVGVGSIYRRYPTKEALVEALRVNAVSEAAALAHEVGSAADDEASWRTRRRPGRGARKHRRPVPHEADHRRNGTGPAAPGRGRPDLRSSAAASEHLHAGLERLVTRDKADGLLPEGFTTADVMQLLLHLRPALPLPRASADALHLRYLEFAMRGLYAQAAAGASLAEGPHWDEWMGSWQD